MRVWLVALAILLAGCSDAPELEADTDAPEGGFLEAEATESTGGITGVIVTQSIEPIAGATVAMISTEESVETDAEGRFSFNNLDPGVYFLDVSADRYLPQQVSATVVAGEIATLRIAIQHDGLPDPYHATHPFQGSITFHATVAWAALEWELDTRFGITTPACDNCVFTFESEDIADGHIFEAVWEDNLEDPRGPSELYWSYAVVDPYQELFGYAPSPIYRTWGADAYETPASPYKVMLLGDADGVQIDQPFEIFLTQWFNTEAPEGWSIVQGTN